MLNWVKQFNIFCFLDNCQYSIEPHKYECIVAAGCSSFISSETSGALKDIDQFIDNKKWTFGHISFELKNILFQFSSTKKDEVDIPLFYFFQPEILILVKGNELIIYGNKADIIYEEILNSKEDFQANKEFKIEQKLSKEEYINKIKSLQHHIQIGDCYEINFCQEFYAQNADIDPLNLFKYLINISPNPFSALYKLNGKYLICASPERFITKKGNQILSQPIKGTSERILTDQLVDEKRKSELFLSEKERSENVMIVDLVRNDLSRICKEGSVKVDELFGIYSFPQVHQMISTISGELEKDVKFSKIIESTFPMGSMTGAPKHKVLQLIEEYEVSTRGIFSGSVGYIDPEGNFDFNVVIRSIMYNGLKRYLSYQVGSAITFYSNAEKEWEECILKAKAIKKVLGN
jgi:para-aminobenzoate synthetase component 1